MLLEAVLTVVIFSIGMTFITQALWANFHTGIRFTQAVRSTMATENKLGLLYATNASQSEIYDAFKQGFYSR